MEPRLTLTETATTSTAVAVAFYEAKYGADLMETATMTNDAGGVASTTRRCSLRASGPYLLVAASDQVTVTYSDLDAKSKRTGGTARDTVRIESEAPGFANLDPVSGTNTTSRVPRLSADITDADSGVVESFHRVRGRHSGTTTPTRCSCRRGGCGPRARQGAGGSRLQHGPLPGSRSMG